MRELLGLDYRSKSLRTLARLRLQRGRLAIDCGANVGDVAAVLAARGAEVHAFEPNEQAFAMLQRRFAPKPHVFCHRAAVGCANGKRQLFLHHNSQDDEIFWSVGSSLLPDKPNVSADRFQEVKVLDLAGFIEALDRPVDVLKMDIEGAEVEVIERLLDSGMINRVRRMYVETHEKQMPELTDDILRLRSRLVAESQCEVHYDWI